MSPWPQAVTNSQWCAHSGSSLIILRKVLGHARGVALRLCVCVAPLDICLPDLGGMSCTPQLAIGLPLTQHTWVDPSQTLLLPAAPGQISRSPVAPRLEGKMGILRAGSTSVPTVMSL